MNFVDFITYSSWLLIITIIYYRWKQSYWKRKKIRFVEPVIIFGNLLHPKGYLEPMAMVIKRLYCQMKCRGWNHGGIYMLSTPNYMYLDLDLIKNVLVKDFQSFMDRGVYYNEKDDPISAHLFAVGGDKWKYLRTKLAPTFTSGKIKTMFPILLECENNLSKRMEIENAKRKPINIKNILECFTTDVICSCAFGLECQSFKEDSPFQKYAKKIFISSMFRKFLASVCMDFPTIAKSFKIKSTPKDVSDFFTKIVTETIEFREKNQHFPKDFLQMLIDLKNSVGKNLTIDDIVAQSFVFFLAGFETSSATMTFVLYQLAKNQDIQNKVRDEINMILAKNYGKITYEAIQDMKYLNQVICETLRLYPPVPFITRECTKDYQVPGDTLIIEKGVKIIIPIIGIHHDQDYYPNPDQFDPERFNGENTKLRHRYAYIPFGEGPRICIGMRFGIMETKIGLTSLLTKYKFFISEKTKEPLKFKFNSFILAAEGDIWLEIRKL